jgi:hypothetical protein
MQMCSGQFFAIGVAVRWSVYIQTRQDNDLAGAILEFIFADFDISS